MNCSFNHVWVFSVDVTVLNSYIFYVQLVCWNRCRSSVSVQRSLCSEVEANQMAASSACLRRRLWSWPRTAPASPVIRKLLCNRRAAKSIIYVQSPVSLSRTWDLKCPVQEGSPHDRLFIIMWTEGKRFSFLMFGFLPHPANLRSQDLTRNRADVRLFVQKYSVIVWVSRVIQYCGPCEQI